MARPSHKGHNDPLTDDERRALTLHHLARIEKAEAAVKAAREHKNHLMSTAQADLGKKIAVEFKELIETRDATKLRERLERTMRIARWRGLPVGAMGDLFAKSPEIDTAREAGRLAGCEGEDCRVPDGYIGEDAVAWTEGWHAGQESLMAAFGKLRMDVESEAPIAADTKDPPFVPPAATSAPSDIPEAPAPPA